MYVLAVEDCLCWRTIASGEMHLPVSILPRPVTHLNEYNVVSDINESSQRRSEQQSQGLTIVPRHTDRCCRSNYEHQRLMVLAEAKPLPIQTVPLHELHSIFRFLPEGFSEQVFQQCVKDACCDELRGRGCLIVLAETTNPPSFPFSNKHANLQGRDICDVSRRFSRVGFLHALCLDGEAWIQRESGKILGVQVHSQPAPCMLCLEEHYTRHHKAIALAHDPKHVVVTVTRRWDVIGPGI